MASPTLPPLIDLKPESDLLHLLFHRNKNQHHSSKWWKWLGMLRRNIKKLLDPTAATGVDKRVEYMRRVIVPSCYTAFTSVIADKQFAPLGLTLLGVLARVHKIIGLEKGNGGEEVVETVVEDSLVKTRTETVMELDMEDLGEAILRREDVVEERGEGGKILTQEEAAGEALLEARNLAAKPKGPSKERPTTKNPKRKDEKAMKIKKKKATELASVSPPPPPRLPSPPPAKEEKPQIKSKRKSGGKEGTKKKKHKKGDEIDDLFAGLL